MGSERGVPWSCSALLALLLLNPRAAHAEPSPAQKETARTLMAQARELRERQDFRGALDRFQAADAIMAVPTTGFELARAHVDLKQLIEARATLRRVIALPVQPEEPPPFQEARAKAEALDAELEARIPALNFVVEGGVPGENAAISVDGEAVAPAALALPYRVNPGHHRIAAEAAHSSGRAEVDVNEREVKDVTLQLAESPAPLTAPSAPGARARRVPTLAYVAGGVGAAGLLVGGVSGLIAMSAKHSAEDGCQAQRCPPSTWPNLDRAEAFATASTIGFVVGAVGAGIAVGSLLFGNSDAPEPPVQAFVSVMPGSSQLSLAGRF